MLEIIFGRLGDENLTLEKYFGDSFLLIFFQKLWEIL
jgi:hypothetical protein